jgi:deoxyribodipyrimidine photo-lyase
VKVDFVLRNLRALETSLSSLGIPLFILRVEEQWGVPAAVANAAQKLRASSVYWNMEYEVNELKRDSQTEELLLARGISKVVKLHDQCIIQPGRVRTKENKIYNVFTPFKRS